MFTRSPEKIEIIVESGDPSVLPLDLVLSRLKELVPVDMSLFLPDFSTHTDDSRVACMAAFADTCKAYYGFGTLACGLPELEIRGTIDDWSVFVSTLSNLQAAFGNSNSALPRWFARLNQRARQILDSVCGGPVDFYQSIFTQNNIGSGGEKAVDGWYAKDFFLKPPRKLDEFPLMWSMVPFHNVESSRRFTDVCGSFYNTQSEAGFRRSGYGRFTVEHL